MDNRKFAAVSSIKSAVQMLAPKQISLISGTVTSLDPIEIQAANDPALIISGASLICPTRVLSEIKNGDNVYMLALNGGRLYYLLDKE